MLISLVLVCTTRQQDLLGGCCRLLCCVAAAESLTRCQCAAKGGRDNSRQVLATKADCCVGVDKYAFAQVISMA